MFYNSLKNFTRKMHFECASINFYYGYRLFKMPNINMQEYMGQLGKHEKLIKRIEFFFLTNVVLRAIANTKQLIL